MKSIFLILAVVFTLLVPHLSLSDQIKCDDGYAAITIMGGLEERCVEISRLRDSYKNIRDYRECAPGYADIISFGSRKCLKSSKLESEYIILSNRECYKGYIEGQIKYNKKKCLQISNLGSDYEVHSKGECYKGYVEGRIQNDKKKCLQISNLGNDYEVHSKGECYKSYLKVQTHSNKKRCFRVSKLSTGKEYEVPSRIKCHKDYVGGRIQYNKKRCLENLKSRSEYKTNLRTCHKNYTEGRMILDVLIPLRKSKECLKISKLTEEYRIYSQGKCATGYIKVLRPNDKNHKDYCERK